MRSTLLFLGAFLLLSMFILANVIITPQQRNQIELEQSVCRSPLGKIGGALSSSIAEDCRKVQIIYQIITLEPFIYLIGVILIILGLVFPESKRNENKEFEKKDSSDGMVSKSTGYCPKCGSEVKGNYCPKCGEKL